jgi:hypothetical protein
MFLFLVNLESLEYPDASTYKNDIHKITNYANI